MLRTLWQFSRPHTLIGSTLSIIALYVLAGFRYAVDVPLLGISLLSALACNMYITGLNQWADVEVDRINKPWLPIPAGRLTRRQAGWVVVISLIAALLSALLLSWQFFVLILIIAGIGTAYSLPPFHLKRHHGLAAGAITLVRGLLVNLGFYLHFRYALSGTAELPVYVWPLVIFVAMFSLGIAWFKDIPDTEGDLQYRFGTVAVRWGRNTALWMGVVAVAIAYASIIIAGGAGILPKPIYFIATHLLLLGIFMLLAFRLKTDDDAAVKQFYMFFWGLFFIEYIIYPIGFLF